MFKEMDSNCYYNITNDWCASWSSNYGAVRYVPGLFTGILQIGYSVFLKRTELSGKH